ncbi:hypothetical protein KIW84_044257 [Lathyrus oleraceus]|uniref:Dymeclin n=1 Tax=Pisum sativum TaxID=3888 RepID=A0A9D5ASS9_PEA|nr:hypothetical protein KIW84_044257 [Pisum sativum]
MRNVLNSIVSVEVNPNTFFQHLELLNFMIITMSTQLLCGPSPGPNDVNPFLDDTVAKDNSLVGYLVSSSGGGSRNPIADNSLDVLLVLIHYC